MEGDVVPACGLPKGIDAASASKHAVSRRRWQQTRLTCVSTLVSFTTQGMSHVLFAERSEGLLKKSERVSGMSSDAQRFARLVLGAFAAAGRTTDAEIVKAGGPSTSTMTKIRATAEDGAPLAEPRQPTWQKIERAANWPVGSAQKVWFGADAPDPLPAEPPPSVRPIGDPNDGLVEFRVSGAFGVQAVVRGPIRDIDALQAAVSKLIAGMSVDDAESGT